jgi:hypothetical protein
LFVGTYDKLVLIQKPRRRWTFWLKRLGKWFLLATLILVIRQAWNYHQATKKLQETLAAMDQAEPGWHLDEIEKAREVVPEEENSARVVVAAAKLLPRGWPPQDLADRFAHLDPVEQLNPDDFTRLQEELDKVRPGLDEARKLQSMPRGRHPIVYDPFILDTKLPHVDAVRPIMTLLNYDALRQNQAQNSKSALIACRAELNTARSLGDEPIAVTQMVRMSGVSLTWRSVERTLAQGETSVADLAAMQDALRSEEAFPRQVVARGERAALHQMFSSIERGDVPLDNQFFKRSLWEEYAYGWSHRQKFREAHPTMLAVMSRWIEFAQLPLHEQIAAERQFDQELRELKESEPIAVLFIPALQKIGEASRRTHALLRCTMVALATERYRLEHKSWPASIDKLCPGYLRAVPLDPFDGQPPRYRRLDDGVVIYSVGRDGIDDGGNLDREFVTQTGVDIGFRLWDVAKRRQPPRPKEQPPPWMQGQIPNPE